MAFWGTPYRIGVDIGHTSIKVVGLRGNQMIGCKQFEGGPFLTHEGIADPQTAAAGIREAMKGAAPRSLATMTQAYSAVAEALLFRKIIEMPKILDPNELRSAVLLEIAQFLPEPVETMEIDFSSLGSTQADKQEIMVVAATSKVIEGYMETFRLAKLQIHSLEPAPAALARAVTRPDDKESLILADISSHNTTVSLRIGGRVEVTGTVNLGGSTVFDEREGESGLSALTDAISDEIGHVLDFSNSRHLEPKEIHTVLLSGSGSLIRNVTESLSKACGLKVKPGIPVIPVPPFCDVRFLAAIGTALYPKNDRS